MAYSPSVSLFDTPRAGMIRSALAAFASAFETLSDLLSRRHAIEALEALSDRELAERGLSRNDIVPFVFRDRMAF